ncbi:carboxylesterase/lipase family protein [Mycetocola tolaasinivorans]|uniref:Carboxylesterase/lipase family protein n=1 Tax=Mycetocola tolaasinivorans TaxID=76635 RepID=A0A3L7ACK6_9MICO|nr:carboxylesterase family protein [Mycetocola tolaasinivorans]RLP77957.1 carboxylesterase/lipase family protein [Mycetocola tolaasinivorans]
MTLTFHPPCGPIIAHLDRGVIRAHGVRYASAERFERPRVAPDHTEPFDAETRAPACPQNPTPTLDEVLGADFSSIPRDEDCLRLSVTAPIDLGPDERVPVMVWVHGGSYVTGCGDIAIMDPRPLVAEQRVIAVTITYRLGLFGFLGNPTEDPARPANLGLRDLVLAFRWVARNIEAFGGDPTRVTAFGQSAGADAIAHLMALPEAPELFSRAIIQSAPLGIRGGREVMSRAMFDAATGITPDTPVPEVLEAQARVSAIGATFGLNGAMPFGCQYGLDPLPPEEWIESAWDRTAARIPVLIGHTAEETRLFIPAIPRLARAVGTPVVGPVLGRVAVSSLTRKVYGASSREFAKRHVRAGGQAHHYVIDWAAAGNPFGSAHTIDLPLLFGDEETWAAATLLTGATWSEIDTAARLVRGVWAAFARGEDLGDRAEIPHTLRYARV